MDHPIIIKPTLYIGNNAQLGNIIGTKFINIAKQECPPDIAFNK